MASKSMVAGSPDFISLQARLETYSLQIDTAACARSQEHTEPHTLKCKHRPGAGLFIIKATYVVSKKIFRVEPG